MLHTADDDASDVRRQLQEGIRLLKNLMKKEAAATVGCHSADADASSECRQPVPVYAVEQLLLQQRAAALLFRSRHTTLIHALISAGKQPHPKHEPLNPKKHAHLPRVRFMLLHRTLGG